MSIKIPETKNVVDFIKKHYPKIEFKPYKMAYQNAIGFIISDGKLIVGYLNKDGNLCKMNDPVDLNKISKNDISKIIGKIPIIKGFNDDDKKQLADFFKENDDAISKKEHNEIVNELKKNIKELGEKDINYQIFYDSKEKEVLLIKKEYEDKINKLTKAYDEQNIKMEEYKKIILTQKDEIVNNLKKYEDEMKEYIKNNNIKFEELQRIYNKIKDEKQLLKNSFDKLTQKEKDALNKLENNQRLLQLKDTKIVELERELNKIDNEKQKLQISIKELLQKQKEYSETNNKLIKELEEINIQKYKNQNELEEKLQNYRNNLKKEIHKTQQIQLQELNVLYKKIEEENKTLQNKINDLINRENEYIDQIKNSEKKNEDLINKIKDLENIYNQIKQEKESIQQQVDNLLLIQNKNTDQYNVNIKNLNEEILELQDNLQELNQEKIKLEKQIEQLNEMINQYDNNIVKNLKSENENYKSENEKLKNDLEQYKTNYINLQKELEEKYSNLMNEINNQNKLLENKIKEVNSQNDQYKEYEELYLKEKKNSETNNKLIKELNINVDNLKNEKDELKKQAIILKETIQSYDDKIENYTKSLEEKDNEIQKYKNEYYEIKKEIESKNIELSKLSDALKDLQQIEDSVKEKEKNLNEMQMLYDNIQLENKKLNDDLNIAKQLVKEAEDSKKENVQKADDILKEYNVLLNEIDTKKNEVDTLENNINEIKLELDQTKDALSKSELKRQMLEGYKERCQQKILEEKDIILSKIKEYNNQWIDWIKNTKENYDDQKIKLINDLQNILKNLKYVSETSNKTKNEYIKLKQNINEIESELKSTINNQLIEINEYKEKIGLLENQNKKYLSEIEKRDDSLENSRKEIDNLKKELQEVKKLLEQNRNTKIEVTVDYDSCYNILQNFYALNNVFYRKQEIIKKLENIIYNGIGYFQNLSDIIKTDIVTRFEIVKNQINSHIEFLDLKKYITSPNFEYLKNKSTRNRVPKDFCDNLVNILEYWNENIGNYREQDRNLTNIYEDLSGAVRVYIRIKPLIGTELKNKTVYIQTIEEKKQKSLILDCSNAKNARHQVKETFGEFYGIFEENYTNEDVYTGIPNAPIDPVTLKVDLSLLEETSVTTSPGLYSTFKQVEEGYSIIIFGYGSSGSGKTFTLLGTKGVPGLLHYGLANLDGITNIRLKNLFEQYYNDKRMNLNFGKLAGRIHNLIREVPQMRDVAINETSEFNSRVPKSVNIDKLQVDDLYLLTNAIEEYRIEKGRIKQTPNNPVSSRSHLYFVFEITFNTGKTGYITIVDTAGRESPIDIFETFIQGGKTSLPSIMAPSGGIGLIEKYMKSEFSQIYTPMQIYEVLKEGFYINESINHLIYFFNQKNYKKTKIALQSQNLDKYNVTSYYVNPMDEEKTYSDSNNCLTIPILKFLDNLSNKSKSDINWKPTKFVTILSVRQEEKYCDQIFETLQFAQSVKSS